MYILKYCLLKKKSIAKKIFSSFALFTKSSGFTIVELLVVIVVIGILAAITSVSYFGISQKANIASIQSDLSNNASKLKLYQVEYGSFPTTLDASNCPTAPTVDAKYCLIVSNGATLSYNGTASTFGLTATKDTTVYSITESTAPKVGTLSLADTDPTNWLKIGTQAWAKYNLNVGARVTGATSQTNNAAIEKYCYDNLEANCTTYGGLYQWGEAMQYTTTEGAQGICPAGSHIPTDLEWQTLELQLGMTPGVAAGQVGATGWRGTDQGTQLKTGGSSGLNMPLGGDRSTGGSFYSLGVYAVLWSSSQSGVSAWKRALGSSNANVSRNTDDEALGFSVRCLGN